MSNTPTGRGEHCSAIAKLPRELVRVWGDGTIEHQRAALLRVLSHRQRRIRLRDLLQAKRAKERETGGLAFFLRGIADGALSSIAAKVISNEHAQAHGQPTQPLDARDAVTVLYALQLHNACDELEEPGEN